MDKLVYLNIHSDVAKAMRLFTREEREGRTTLPKEAGIERGLEGVQLPRN